MFKTKQEVDKYISDNLRKINTETERNLRCFFFAKLYFNVGDYEQAVRYVTSYLSVKSKSPEGHNLLGRALEKLGRTQAALEAFKTSLQQDPKQNTLVLKVCELMSKDDAGLDNSGARYFCELAQSLDPRNPIVSNLKQKLITNECKDPNEVTEFLLKELENRPMDVGLRVKLLKHFLENNLVKEAYKHAFAIEQKKFGIFDNSLVWYETFAEVLVRYQKDTSTSSQLTWEFWIFLASVLEKLAGLSLDEHLENAKTNLDYVTAVFNFDQSLLKASEGISSCGDKNLIKEFLNHYEAQLCLHFSVLAFKQAKRDLVTFKEVQNIILPLLFIAYNSPVPDTKSIWFNNLPENRRLMVSGWYNEGSYRCSQAGNVLLGLAKDKKNILLERVYQYSTGMWREKVFKQLFVKRDQQLKLNTSYFNTSTSEPVIKLPEYHDLIKFNEVSQLLHPHSLHHYVWLALNYRNLSDFELRSFDGLQYAPKNANNCAAETISVLDVQSFVLCAGLCAESKSGDLNGSLSYFAQERPPVLPASITGNLGTLTQSKFLLAAYKMYKHENTLNNTEIRMILIKGIEVVRCVGNHGLDVKLLVALGTIFSDRVKKLTKQSEVDANAARAELYWRAALPMLEKLKNEHAIIYPNNRIFEYKSNKELTQDEIEGYMEKGQLFLGVQLMRKKDHEKALKMFEKLRDPHASFYQYQIVRQMAEANKSATSETRTLLWTRARDCLYLTLDRLREPSQDREHPLNAILGTEIEKVERVLARLQHDSNSRIEFDDILSDDEQYLSTYTHQVSFQNGKDASLSVRNETMQHHSTPLRLNVTNRQEARPSPERLDAQIRQLMASESLAMTSIQEQNKMMAELRMSTDEIRDAVKTLTSAMTSIGDVKKMVNDLTNSVDDRLQSVTDMVQEMRRELNDIKKEQGKNAQISVEDLYDLDPDYNSPLDYNLSSSLNQAQTSLSNLYSNYPRLPQAPNPNMALYGGQALYPPIFPGLPYPYGPLGLAQPGTVPFLPQVSVDQQHMAQMSNVPGLPQSVYPSAGLQMAPKESPKTGFGGVNLTQAGFSGYSPSHQPLQQPKEPPKPPNSFLGQSLVGLPMTSSVVPPASRAPPVNVVITSSDPLPTMSKSTTAQPVLSVTIPPQHIKGNTQKPPIGGAPGAQQAHNYQIPLPSQPTLGATPSVLSQPAPLVATESLLTNVPSPAFSAIAKTPSPSKNVSLGIHIEKTLDKTFPTPDKSNVSTHSVEEYDPRPDFQPIVPLPDEVPVTTGEENETELYCQRAKLFRLALGANNSKEWKERGIGNIKILRNPDTGKVRVLMRREQVHKICANHFLTRDVVLTPMANNDRAYIWAAHDYADGQIVLEKFCARFKTAEEAKQFAEAFNAAKEKQSVDITASKPATPQPAVAAAAAPPNGNLGGFKFTSTPTFKPKEEPKADQNAVEMVKEPVQAGPFASFTFGAKPSATNLFESLKTCEPPKQSSPLVQTTPNKKEEEEEEEDFVPTAEFRPVVDKLPDLVEVKTGEEYAEVVLEERCKLFRMDSSGDKKEWKERGLGNIKVLREQTVRLVMRREQVHKVCLNHQVLKTMTFKKNATDPKAVVWHAHDFSEGVLQAETFTARFKTPELADKFLKVVQNLQTTLDENNQVTGTKHHKPDPTTPKTGFGDKFKAAKGSWECKNCYIVNDAKAPSCVACETPKSGTSPQKDQPTFSFGVKPVASTGSVKSDAVKSGWGDQFKPASGSWECKGCYVTNAADKTKCVSCETPKEGAAEDGAGGIKGISLDTGGQKFNFGMPTAASQPKPEQTIQKFSFSVPPPAAAKPETAPVSGFGDSFRPKPGTWECKSCYIRNDASNLYCVSCESPKDETVPKKEESGPKGVNLETPGLKFNFGMPPGGTPTTNTFAFGDTSATKTAFTWKPAETTTTDSKDPVKDDKFTFGSPQKHDFEFKPRSPRRISTGQGEESDASYVEEEEPNVYFKPVVPLPDIVEVKTGEENEEVLYSHRAKLYRFSGGEWKERGPGDVKVLRDTATKKLRVVMRREQVLKICLNHWLTKDVEYLAKDEKTWLFHAADFSEGEISRDQFCLRFKDGVVAAEFKKAIDEALGGATGDGGALENKKSDDTGPDSDVEFVAETKVTPEEEKEAVRLGLPPKFLAYRQRPDCTCDQCQKDDEYLRELFNKGPPKSEVSSWGSGSATYFGTPKTHFGTPSSAGSVFGSPASGFSFGTPSTGGDVRTPKAETLKSLLKKPSVIAPPSLAGRNYEDMDEKQKMAENKRLQNSSPEGRSISSANPDSSGGNIFRTAGNNLFKTTSATSIFGGGGAQNSVFGTGGGPNLFGAQTENIFSSPATTATPTMPIDDSSQKSTYNSSGNIFTTTGTTNIFQNNANNSTSSIFRTTDSVSYFSSPKPATPSVFGAGTQTPTSGIFGGGGTSLFGNNAAKPGDNQVQFGQTLFGNKAQPKLTDANLTFGSTSSATAGLKENDEPVLKVESGLSFATLAAKSGSDKPAFTTKSDDNKTPFAFLGAGAPVFGGGAAAKKDTENPNKPEAHSDNEEAAVPENDEHDPHFEPIVPLPDQIVVSTGEEEESVVFNERAKLFRFDSNTKEWKERGVGQFKVLLHPQNRTYRLLLRREQVHKVVLNQRINADLDVQPMSTSDKAWMWVGLNYCEDESRLEQLAIRFKNVELAQAFKKCIDETIKTIADEQANRSQDYVPTTVTELTGQSGNAAYRVEEPDDAQEDDYGEEDDDDDDEDYEEEEKSMMFTHPCTLSERTPSGWQNVCDGELQVYYDPEMYTARICVLDQQGEAVCNTTIAINTNMELKGNECVWRSVDWSDPSDLRWRTFKASFGQESAAQEFHSTYLEGVNYAHEVGAVDEIPGSGEAENSE